jgi:predicted PurR-regulated permease PerM
MTKRVMVIALGIMTTLLGLVVFWQFRVVLIYVLLSLVIAATFRPISKSESRQNLKTRLMLVLQYLVAFVVVGLLLFIVGRFLIHDFQQLAQNLSEQSSWVLPRWVEGGPLAKWLPTPANLFLGITSQPSMALSAVLGFTESIGSVLSGLVIALFLSVYWSINQNHFERLWLSLLPAEQRKHARNVWRTIEADLGAYSRSELIQSMLAVLALGIGYWLLGSPYPALLAVTGAIAWLIPVVGGVLALILPLVVGLLSSPQLAIMSVLYTILVLVILQVSIEPRLFKIKQDNPLLTFIILLAMADAFGLLGIIVAPPVSVILQSLWRLLVHENVTPEIVVHISDLKERYAQLQVSIEQMEGPPPPLVVSSMERLTGLLEKAEPILENAPIPEPQALSRPRNLPG